MDPLNEVFLIVSIAAIAIGGLTAIIRFSIQLGALQIKVDTMWAFQMRRAFTEAVHSGVATLNSPLKFDADALARLDPIKDDLINFNKMLPATMSDATRLLRIEDKFGADLVTRVSIPCKLPHGTCLLMALSVVKQSSDLHLF